MWMIDGKKLSSRFFIGTAQYPTLEVMQTAITASQANVITIALKRQLTNINKPNKFWDSIKQLNCHLLPNTAGCKNAIDAVNTAEMAREIFSTNWVKLEVIGDDYTLQPDPFELVKAAEILNKNGFTVFPYCTEDLILCQRLRDCGCQILMPWAAPIGSGKGVLNPYALEILRARLSDVLIIIDAGIGKPSHATQVMEMGFDGVLLNTAVSNAIDPVKMAAAFRDAIIAGRNAYEAGIMPERNIAHASTSLIDTPFWLQNT
ncbi:MAG: hypothetical protein ACD_46C00437G0007, partial [uncultured bacterium]